MAENETREGEGPSGQDSQAPDLTALRSTIAEAVYSATVLARTLARLPDALPYNTPTTKRLNRALDRVVAESDRVQGIVYQTSEEDSRDGN